MLVILALAKLKQEDREFKASLGYTANSKPAWIKMRPSQKGKKIAHKVCFSENGSSVQDCYNEEERDELEFGGMYVWGRSVIKDRSKLGVVHVFNPSTLQVEAGGSL